MNNLEQAASGILGSVEDSDFLSRSDAARILVVSDTHGHYDVFEAIVREFGPESSALLFAGDGMWDIVHYLENAYESDRLRDALPPVVAFVAGNGDGDQYRISLKKTASVRDDTVPFANIMVPQRQIVRAAGWNILLVHGHRYSVDVSTDILTDSAHAMNCDIAVFGHTHVQYCEQYDHIMVLNPGSPARPRGSSDPGFAFLDIEQTRTEPSVTFYAVMENDRGLWVSSPVQKN